MLALASTCASAFEKRVLLSLAIRVKVDSGVCAKVGLGLNRHQCRQNCLRSSKISLESGQVHNVVRPCQKNTIREQNTAPKSHLIGTSGELNSRSFPMCHSSTSEVHAARRPTASSLSCAVKFLFVDPEICFFNAERDAKECSSPTVFEHTCFSAKTTVGSKL